MIYSEFDRPDVRPESKQGSGEKDRQTQSALEAEVLLELFNLLEEHAPVWYTEQHHSRAVAALSVLRESQAKAAPSQKAGK